jgi:hypothetical protein
MLRHISHSALRAHFLSQISGTVFVRHPIVRTNLITFHRRYPETPCEVSPLANLMVSRSLDVSIRS